MEIIGFLSAVLFFFFHIGDIATDVIACVTYANNGFTSYFYATLAFIIIPFVYIVYMGPFEAGGLDGVSCLGVHGCTFVSYFTGPLFPYLFKGRISDENVRKVEGITTFGSGYMEDIPQVIIACFFVLSSHNEKATNQEKTIALVQLGFSALSGIYKMVVGGAKVGNGNINCCGRNIRLNV